MANIMYQSLSISAFFLIIDNMDYDNMSFTSSICWTYFMQTTIMMMPQNNKLDFAVVCHVAWKSMLTQKSEVHQQIFNNVFSPINSKVN